MPARRSRVRRTRPSTPTRRPCWRRTASPVACRRRASRPTSRSTDARRPATWPRRSLVGARVPGRRRARGLGQDSHPFGPGDGLRARRLRIAGGAPAARPFRRRRRAPRRRATRCSARPAWATSAGCSRPATRDPAASTAASCCGRSSPTARARRAGGPRRVDLTIVGARPRLGGARLDAMRDAIAGAARARPRRRRRSRPRPATCRARGRRPGHRAAGARDGRAVGAVAPHDASSSATRSAARLEPFEPLEPGRRPHLQLRPDGLRRRPTSATSAASCSPTCCVRYLRWSGYASRWVMNITDVDDKIIRGAAAEGITHRRADRAATRPRSWPICDRLRMTPPDVHARAPPSTSPRWPRSIAHADRAAATPTGPTTARSSSASPRWPAYGRLARLDPTQQRVGERVEADEYGKDDVRDFALWKGPRDRASRRWATAIGEGRPGWHIECSAMSMALPRPSRSTSTPAAST